MAKSLKGKLIVIDGIDGSGKKTQTDLLVKNLKEKEVKVKVVDFPQYHKKSSTLVQLYLTGEFGSAQEVTPYQASIFYACDRFAAKNKIQEWLKQGYFIISNRYTSANQIHQAGKIKNLKAKNKFLDWLENLEFKILGISQPDLVFYLSLPPALAQNLVSKKGFRKYLSGNKKDIHETDYLHLMDAWKNGLLVAKKYSWQVIKCYQGKKVLPRPVIAQKIWAIASKKLKVK